MKSHIFIACFIFLGMILSSCDPNSVDSTTKNYWEQNALVRHQLKGKVKTITEINYGTNVTQFNENGYITSITQSGDGSNIVSTYTYLASGELNKIVTTGTGINTSTTTYEYDTHAKYVVIFPMHVYETGLVLNLKAIINDGYRSDYKFEGDNLLIINTNRENSKDTTIIKYSGKYPASTTTDYSFIKDITVADNGMFKTYTEGFFAPNYTDSRIYTFKADAEYMLKESVNYVTVQGIESTSESETYTYNDKKDLIKIVSNNYVTDIVYEYDAQNNWTKETTTTLYTGSTPYVQEVTRTISYWTDSKTSN